MARGWIIEAAPDSVKPQGARYNSADEAEGVAIPAGASRRHRRALRARRLDAHRRATTVFERHRQETEALVARLELGNPERPAFGGEAQPGNAWDLYKEVWDAWHGLTTVDLSVIPELDDSGGPEPVPDDQVLADVYAQLGSDIEKLEQALWRESVDPHFSYESLPTMQFPYVQKALRASNVSVEDDPKVV